MSEHFCIGFEKVALSKYEKARAKRQGLKNPDKYSQVGVLGKATSGKILALAGVPLGFGAGAAIAKKLLRKGR